MKLNRKNLRRLILKEMAGMMGSAGGGANPIDPVDQLIKAVQAGDYGLEAQEEYNMTYNNLNAYGGYGAKAISFFIPGFDESMIPNRFYTEKGSQVNPGYYWGQLNRALMNPGSSDITVDSQNLLNALFGPENPHGMEIFTPTGAGRAAAILHFLRDQGII